MFFTESEKDIIITPMANSHGSTYFRCRRDILRIKPETFNASMLWGSSTSSSMGCFLDIFTDLQGENNSYEGKDYLLNPCELTCLWATDMDTKIPVLRFLRIQCRENTMLPCETLIVVMKGFIELGRFCCYWDTQQKGANVINHLIKMMHKNDAQYTFFLPSILSQSLPDDSN